MKLYDFAARARAVVATERVTESVGRHASALLVATDPETFADAVRRANCSEPAELLALREWAEGETWAERWPLWAAAAFGEARCAS